MSELPVWVVLLLGAVFAAFGAGLFAMGRNSEPWGCKLLWARALMWSAVGLGVVVSYWSEGLGGIIFLAAVLARLALAFIPWRPPTTSPTPDSPPDRR